MVIKLYFHIINKNHMVKNIQRAQQFACTKWVTKIGLQSESKWNVFLTIQFCLKINSGTAGFGISWKIIILRNIEQYVMIREWNI